MKLSRILSTLLRAEPPAMFTQAELDERFEQEQDKAYRQSDVEFLRAYRQGAFDVLTALGISDDAANAGADECVETYKDAMSLMADDYR